MATEETTYYVFLTICSILSTIIGFKIKNWITPRPLPKLEARWWGPGNPRKEDKSIRPFQIKVPEKELDDLKYRLDHARKFTPPLEGQAQEYGMNTNLLEEIVEFWKTEYHWNERETFFNKMPQFLTEIQGLDVHYIHVKPQVGIKKNILPLLILHGWPGSVREFYDIIPILTTPKDEVDFVFEIIAPSIPGFGFSQAAVRPGLGPAQITLIFKNLMQRLGHGKFYVQGGDFGAIILQNLATIFPESVLGFHSNMVTVHTPLVFIKSILGLIYPKWFVREDHVDRVYPLKLHFGFKLLESGYLHIQATKPDTIGVALKDSPVGLAAYILEKFTTGTNPAFQKRQDGGLQDFFTYTDLLDNVMVYWITGCMPTAMRLYAETFSRKNQALGITRHPVKVPSACARFRYDFYTPDNFMEEIYPKMVHLMDYEGGHFAAFQLPEVLANDVFLAVKKFEAFNKSNCVI